jgi:hypothetical protein
VSLSKYFPSITFKFKSFTGNAYNRLCLKSVPPSMNSKHDSCHLSTLKDKEKEMRRRRRRLRR